MSKKYYYIDTHTGETIEQSAFRHHAETVFIIFLGIAWILGVTAPIWLWFVL